MAQLPKQKADRDILRILVDLRQQHKLSRDRMATLFGLTGNRRRGTVSAWERGEAIPPEENSRRQFITYLLDDLQLRHKPNKFREVWDVLIEQWKWKDLNEEEKQQNTLDAPPNPYRGLKSFTKADAANFFGRERFTIKLQQAIHHHPLTILVGPSGSGKSSVIQAGLIPILEQNKNIIIIKSRPGLRPFHALARSLISSAHQPSQYFPKESKQTHQKRANKLAEQWQQDNLTIAQAIQKNFQLKTGDHLLIIVDQFEELFADSSNQHRQEQFLENLITLTDNLDLSVSLLLAIRVDFLEEAMSSPTLSSRLQDHLWFLPPMTEEELEAAILKPAQSLHIDFEAGLLSRILLDISHAREKLTLLEFALEQLWTHPKNKFGLLTIAAYQEIGRVSGALSKHAESVFKNLERKEQELVPRLFVQLVKPGKRGKATRHPATRSELGQTRWDLAQTLAADARLVVIRAYTPKSEQARNDHEPSAVYLDEPEAEIIHEALIDEWERLKDWIDEARDFRAWQEDLRVLVRQWEATDRSEGAMLRGTPLITAEDWLVKRVGELSQVERDFINSGKALREHEANEREAIRQRELDDARRLAEEAEARRQAEAQQVAEAVAHAREQKEAASRLRRRAIWLAVMVGAAIILAIAATGFGILSNRNAGAAATNEAEAVAAQGTAEAETIERTTAEAVANSEVNNRATAEAIAVSEAGRANAAQATAEAEQARAEREAAIARSRELAARSAQMLGQNYELAMLLALEAGQSAPTFEADTAIRQTLYHPGRTLSLVTGHETAVWHVAWDRTGSRLATAGDDGTARIWDAASGQELLTLTGHQSTVWHVAWNTSGTRLLTTGFGGTAHIWDTANGQELLALVGHQATIGFAAWSPSDTRIITVSDDFTARIWDAESGQLKAVLRGHEGQVVHAAWAPDGSQVVTAAWDSTARLWDSETGEIVAVMNAHTQPIRHVAWDPVGTRIVTASNDGSALIWDVDNAELSRLAGPDFFGAPHEAIWYADWDSSGNRIVTASSDGKAEVWDTQTGNQLATLAGHTNSWVVQATWSPDNATILTASWDGTARIWDGQTGLELIRLAAHNDGLSHVAWHPSGTQVATASWDGTARIWELSPGSESPVLAGHLFGNLHSVRHLSWDMSGTRLVTASEDDTAIIWRVEDGTILNQLRGHDNAILEANWNRDNSEILTASADGTVRIWNSATGAEKVLFSGHTGSINHAAWNWDEAHIVTASADATARIWDATSGEVLLTLDGHQAGVNDTAWDATGTRLVTAGADGTARIWDAQTGKMMAVLSGHEDDVNAAQWNDAGTQIATASDDGTARIWDAETGEELFVLLGHTGNVTGIRWHPSESRLLTNSWDDTARIWDTQTGEELFVLSGHTETVTMSAWSPDGIGIVTVSNDNTARVWDGSSGELLAILGGHDEGFRFTFLHYAAWSPDGKRIATAASDGTARVHFIAMLDLITAVCQQGVRNMSLPEWQRLMGITMPYHRTCGTLFE